MQDKRKIYKNVRTNEFWHTARYVSDNGKPSARILAIASDSPALKNVEWIQSQGKDADKYYCFIDHNVAFEAVQQTEVIPAIKDANGNIIVPEGRRTSGKTFYRLV